MLSGLIMGFLSLFGKIAYFEPLAPNASDDAMSRLGAFGAGGE